MHYFQKNIEWKYGGLMAAGFIAYFLLMRVLGLYHITELRVLNFVIHAIGIFLAMMAFEHASPKKLNYVSGVLLGMRTTVIASVPFAFFILIYLTAIDPEFMIFLKENAPHGAYLSPGSFFFLIIVESIAAGTIISYISMRYAILHLEKQKSNH